ncbi:MAG: chromate efflux transporter [Eubacteriales bacterium]|nr:chromate efflux transporter [Eubacteriales bacterium]
MEVKPIKTEKAHWGRFLGDVAVCALGAYGGPEAHYGVFIDQLVVKRRYLSEEEMTELIGLTGILPGPSSTQTIVAIGYQVGGPLLALLTFLVWAMPALIFMTALSFFYIWLERVQPTLSALRYVSPMAVGFMLTAGWRIGRKVVKDWLTGALFLASAVITGFLRTPWIFPAVLIAGGLLSIACSKEKDIWNRSVIRPPWWYLIAFAVIAIGSLLTELLWKEQIVRLFADFYRYGYLVIGGGQVVIPMMYGDLVEATKSLTSQEFLTGFGLVQGLPGPMFSFSAFAGGMAANGAGAWTQIAGAAAAGIGIFLPGVLLIYFVYPIWEQLKQIRAIKISIKGITAVAGGLIAASALVLLVKNGLTLEALIVTLATAALLMIKRIPAPLIVLAVLIAGALRGLVPM